MKKAHTIANLEFKITFSETNIRHLLGEKIINHELIEWHRSEIQKDSEKVQALKKDAVS
jgi:hypothetical protein